MTIRIGADGTATSISALQALGVTFVCRYLSDYSWKNLTAPEARSLKAAGIDVVSNWENGTNDYAGGYAQGAAYAARAEAQHLALGGPASAPIYFSVDTPLSGSEANAYFQGIVSVLGVSRVGAYGCTAVLRALVAAGLVSYTWRTMSTDWPGGAGGDDEFTIQQTGAFDNDYDRDAAFVDDFGQWSAHTGGVAAPASTEGTVTVDAPSVVVEDGDDEMSAQSNAKGIAILGWAAGSRHVLQIGYDGASPTVRVVAQLATGPLVLNAAWTPSKGSAVMQLPPSAIPNIRGVHVTALSGNDDFAIFAD